MTLPTIPKPRTRRGPAPKQPPANAADLIRDLAADGWAILGIAKRLGTSKDTFARWLDQNPDLQEAFDAGRENERYALHNMLYRQAMEHGNATAAMFLLKARHGYREGDQSQTGGRVNVTIALPGAMTLQQFTSIGAKAAPSAVPTIEGKEIVQ
ncbi:hypothetical protein U8326_02230 [Tsuneonella sp. CC-YZS046]|uniref:hypothetical protein n=1 Tax=Tsuneonella sp. CC-YZS046 TaxID=3042152 RepID=UPI002D769DE9|nr:hypothetical protein [Tsuneonella sp. CC-YZS046]WRO67011.1 hypothetical protein U8326_02230 [Tsuneonella sp. CC-YZS046]